MVVMNISLCCYVFMLLFVLVSVVIVVFFWMLVNQFLVGMDGMMWGIMIDIVCCMLVV